MKSKLLAPTYEMCPAKEHDVTVYCKHCAPFWIIIPKCAKCNTKLNTNGVCHECYTKHAIDEHKLRSLITAADENKLQSIATSATQGGKTE
jgi:hypothetical protein